MKQIIFSFIALFFLSIPFSHAQDIKWGPLYKKEGGLFARFNIIGSDDDHYYINMRPKKKGGTLLKFDYNHKLKSTSSIALKYGKQKLIPSGFVTTASKTFAYASDHNKSTLDIFVSEFNGGKFGKVKKAYNQKFKLQVKAMWFGLVGYTDSDASGLEVSENKKFVAFSNAYSTIDKKKKDKIGFVVFDENMEVVWKKQQNFPYRDKDFNVVQVVVSNKGEIFFTASVRDKKKRGKRDKNMLRSEYKVFHITENSMTEIDIKLSRKSQVSDAGLFIHEETNKAYLGGFYTEYGKKTNVNGVFFGEVDLASEEAVINTHSFSNEFMEGMASKKAIEKGKGLSFSFNINDMITFKDGSFSFLAERYYVTTHTSTVNGKTTTYYVYHSDEIIIPRFDKNGDLLKIEKIQKNFASRSHMETSYSFNAYNGKIYLVFNDYKKRSERKDMKKQGKKKAKRYTDLCIIDENGEIAVNKTIFTNKETDAYYIPSLSFDQKDKLILGTVAGRNKKYKFGTMKLK